MYSDAVRLAVVLVKDTTGRDVVIPAEDVLRVNELQGGDSLILFRSGGSMQSQTTAADIRTAIDTLWDEFNA